MSVPPVLLGQANAAIFLVIAAALVALMLVRRRRPVTQSRVMDVALSAILFAMVGLRYAALAAVALIAPAYLFGTASDTSLVVPAVTLYAIAAAAGIAAHRASVGWRLLGAALFGVVATVDLVMMAFVLPVPSADVLGAALAAATAVAALVLAAFHWTHRTATPNPLASREQRLDY
jgi:hypothetical protein